MIAVPAEETLSPTDKEVEIISAPLEKQPKTPPPPLNKPTPSGVAKVPLTTPAKDKEKTLEVGRHVAFLQREGLHMLFPDFWRKYKSFVRRVA